MQNTTLTENQATAKVSIATIDERVTSYTDWLAKTARHNNLISQHGITHEYIYEALKPIRVYGQEVRTFAPFRYELSAIKTTTPRQRLILQGIGLIYVLGFIFFSTLALQVLIAAITLFYVSDLLLYFLVSIRTLRRSKEEHIDDELVAALVDAEWPNYTILCPMYREAEVVPQFTKAMLAMDYPTDRLQILLLTEEVDVETRQIIETLHLPAYFTILTVPEGEPRTKPRACNFGLLHASGDYIVIYDAEDIPDPLQLKKAVLTFASHDADLACVQAKLNYYNSEQNLLTRWFTAEYSVWFDLTLPGLQTLNVSLPLGGTSNHFRTDTLCNVGAWDAFNVTEDCDLGLRLGYYNLRTVIMDSTTYEEANSQVKNWMRQRSRWIKGYMQTYLVYMRSPLHYLREGYWRQFLSLQLLIGGKTVILLINPLMWMLLLLYILFPAVVGNAYHVVYPAPVLYAGTLCLLFGNFIYLYIHLIGCIKRGHYTLIKWTLLIPVYWAMTSMAAYVALYQLVFNPHFWEKTLHGLHLHKRTTVTKITFKLGAFELITKSIASTISLTKDTFNMKLTRKTTQLKIHTGGKLPAIPRQAIVSAMPDTMHTEIVVVDETMDDDTSPTVPRLLKVTRQSIQISETSETDETITIPREMQQAMRKMMEA